MKKKNEVEYEERQEFESGNTDKIIIDGSGYLDNVLELTEIEILATVRHWYLNMHPDIFQDEEGQDLDEVCGSIIDQLYISKKQEDEKKKTNT
jgi:hypothetical protein